VVELTMSFPVFFGMAILPLLSAASSKAEATKIVWRANRALALAGSGITLLVIVLAPEMARFIGGANFAAAALPLAILALGNLLIYQTTAYAQAQLASDNQSNLLRVTSTLFAVNVALNFILIPLFSTAGAAWAVVVSEFLSLLMLRNYFRRSEGTPLPWPEALKPILPAAGGAVVALVVKVGLEHAGAGSLLTLVFAGGLGALGFAGLAYLGGLVRAEDLKLIRRSA
jgi:O-antigen/teichoic acid export membrane protein